MIDFMQAEPTNDYTMGIDLYNSDWSNKFGWQQFGITDDISLGMHAKLTLGETALVDLSLAKLKPDIWYRLVLAIDENGRILIMTWERDNPTSQPSKYRSTPGVNWTGGAWIFWVHNQQAIKWHFDNFYQIAFSKIK